MSEPEDIKQEGEGAKTALPPLYLPVNGLTLLNDSAATMYKGFATSGEYFIRDGLLVKAREKENGIELEVIPPAEIPSQVEYHFTVMKKKEGKDEIVSYPVNCSSEDASALWNCKDEARKHSLPLRLLANYPVLIEVDGKPTILGKGYHPETGGIYVIHDLEIPTMSLNDAKEILLDLYADYNFVSESDLSRAMAHTLSPSLKLGNLLGNDDFPLDLGLGNQSQVGKTRRMRIIATIYGETAYTFTKHEGGGVGGTSESAGMALVSGKLFILIDNVRGDFDSALIESILRGTQTARVRIPYRAPAQVKANRSIWQFTSNGVIVPPDFANRAVIVNINDPVRLQAGEKRKSKAGWDNATFTYIAQRPGEYLGAVHKIVGDWIEEGKPRTKEDRHTFTGWVQAEDYIVTQMLGLKPLMNHHQTSHSVVSNPKFAWLRSVVLEAVKKQPLRYAFAAHEFGEITDDKGIDIPGVKGGSLSEISDRNREIGKILKQLFKESETLEVEKYQVSRIDVKAGILGTHHDEERYTIDTL